MVGAMKGTRRHWLPSESVRKARRAGLAATAQPQPQHSPHLPSSLVHTGSPMQMLDQHKLRGKSNLRHAEKSIVRIAYHVARY